MANDPRGWRLPALGLGLVLALVGAPLAFIGGVRAIERATTLSITGGWFMVVGGVLMVIGGVMTVVFTIRSKPPE